MDRDGTPRPQEEEPLKQTGPLGVAWTGEPEPRAGDVLSDGWSPDQESAPVPGDDTPEHPRPEHERADHAELGVAAPYGPGDRALDGDHDLREGGFDGADDYERPEGYASPDDGWDADRTQHDPDDEPRTGFLGSGWTGEDDAEEEKKGQNRRLILAMVAIVVLAVSGGWIVSSSVGSRPEAACSSPSDCAPAGQPLPTLSDGTTPAPSSTDPTTEPPAEEPSATPSPTSPTPGATAPAARTTTDAPTRDERDPTTRPEPTHTRDRAPDPRPKGTEDPQVPRPETSEDPEPTEKPSPTPPPTTEAPEPAPTPTKKERGGGLLDWLF
ncbi:hypothetical protein Skr01_61250 [Sphaerisporangium krabiense]|uniref:Uncharacterized protein n=1 Tax=Sphaerisporangium krabiense TaxID=763782 RepID=A0A7W8Z302_9ACTN|nr:hypothetical protein [Sphaerisporangium krabiense]MBB5626295.1 hypothetical protein [Sphaerisporangium krabiense]GII66040.1 hypothetical protein Skr01_61250 [Sphaerisporangium krabiense]